MRSRLYPPAQTGRPLALLGLLAAVLVFAGAPPASAQTASQITPPSFAPPQGGLGATPGELPAVAAPRREDAAPRSGVAGHASAARRTPPVRRRTSVRHRP